MRRGATEIETQLSSSSVNATLDNLPSNSPARIAVENT